MTATFASDSGEAGPAAGKAAVVKAPGEQVVYTDIIALIFESKCYSCHNDRQAEGASSAWTNTSCS